MCTRLCASVVALRLRTPRRGPPRRYIFTPSHAHTHAQTAIFALKKKLTNDARFAAAFHEAQAIDQLLEAVSESSGNQLVLGIDGTDARDGGWRGEGAL